MSKRESVFPLSFDRGGSIAREAFKKKKGARASLFSGAFIDPLDRSVPADVRLYIAHEQGSIKNERKEPSISVR